MVIIIAILIYLLICLLMFIMISKVSIGKAFSVIDKNIEKTLLPYKDIIDKGNKWVNEQKTEKVSIKSYDNLKLHGILIEKKNEKGIIILAHGYRSTKERDLYSSLYNYYNMGYSLLLIDERGCGLSEGKYITFGAKESLDINSWANYLHKKKHNNIILGGVSLGATAVLMVNNKYVKAIIADSGFVSASREVIYVINHYFHIPGVLFIIGINLFCNIFGGFDLRKTNTFDNLSKINIPILFIHGLDDDFVPPKNSLMNYNVYGGEKDLFLVENANHGMGYLVDQEEYLKRIKKIIKKVK